VRHRSEVYLILAVSVFALIGVTGLRLQTLGPANVDPGMGTIEPTVYVDPVTVQRPNDARVWFQSIRMYCNPTEVQTRMRWQPAPGGAEGDMYKAACYALAGRIDLARGVIEGMPAERRYQAAGVVFEAGHPAADAGDEIAAGPLMELVVEYWPNHYMALYHAGAASYERGDYDIAEDYLERFLVEYANEDGWRSSAKSMLATIAEN
jgi:tetratricopeptide (TPR) repeat protein